MKIYDCESLKAYQLIDEMEKGKSLLWTLGCTKQYLFSLPLKLLVKVVSFFVFCGLSRLPQNQQYLVGRKRLVAFLKKVAPFKMQNSFAPHYTSPLIIGFNHSSTGDILRLLAILLDRYPAKSLYFPVKLNFYEALTPIAKRLDALSIYLYPIITPNMFQDIITPKNKDVVRRIKVKLEKHYLCMAEMCCKGYGALVVAPSATRKDTVFDNQDQANGLCNETLLPTMTILLKYLQRNHKIVYAAVSITPPTFNRGFNIFKTYGIKVAQEFSTDKATELDSHSNRGFEYAFLRALVDNLPFARWHPLAKDYESASF